MENVKIIRSDRKTIGVHVERDGSVVVRAPRRAPMREIERFLSAYAPQIEDIRERRMAENAVPRLNEEELASLKKEALPVFESRARHFAPLLGVEYRHIGVGSQRSRWGSCSGKGNLRFNCLLLLAPPEVLDSVVVHELCHLREMNHSPRFYALVRSVFPDYDAAYGWLRENGGKLVARLP